MCRSCYDYLQSQAEARRAFAPAGVHGHRSDVYADAVGGEPEPTDAEPGSEEKLLVLEERCRKKQWLHHPLDRKLSPAATDSGGDALREIEEMTADRLDGIFAGAADRVIADRHGESHAA
jgi:hypothetical protein